ncbi:hypothetical protein BMF94_6091 [Rhodotorula taiwanensis]|uniref:Uncharacterized protein n=1 Tax=Rhodotorula taiwanensis TaxID=741276 RepID=A0A2S5B2A3_9BASI|nr:hypothetical protein BMF94_6091 [Rhodotorula taiwanensis]
MRLYKLSLSVVLSLVASTAIGAVDSSRKGFARERRLHGHAHLAARSQHLSGAYSGAGATQKMSASSYTVPAATSSSSMSASPVATNSISGAASYTSPASDGSAYATPSLHMASATTTSGLAPVPSVSSTPPSTDLVVLQLAVVLEAFEGAFYRQGLAKFGLADMMAAGLSRVQAFIVIEQIQILAIDEDAHLQALSSAVVALGAQPFTGCGYDFSKALADPLTFLSAARIIEAVGVSAYLGAAHLLKSADLLEAAASILTLEARHQSLLNVLNGGSFNPQSFDIQLTPQAVLSLVGGFLTGCQATNSPLSVRSGNPDGTFQAGTQLVVEVMDVTVQIEILFCQIIVGGSSIALVMPANSCYIPTGIDGPVAVYLTKDNTPLATNVVIQNQLTIVAGPGLIFVDEKITILAALLGPSSQARAENGGENVSRTLPCANLGGWAISTMRGADQSTTNGTTSAMPSSMVASYSAAEGAAASVASKPDMAGAPASSWSPTSPRLSGTPYRFGRRRRTALHRHA